MSVYRLFTVSIMDMCVLKANCKDPLGFTVEYTCVFGISSPIPGLHGGEHVNSYGEGVCVITFHNKDGRVFWFIIEKLPKKYTYPISPRFTPQDASEFCGRLADVHVFNDVTVGHLWRNRTVVSMNALEEGLLSTWSFERMVLLGDSVHKVSLLCKLSTHCLLILPR